MIIIITLISNQKVLRLLCKRTRTRKNKKREREREKKCRATKVVVFVVKMNLDFISSLN